MATFLHTMVRITDPERSRGFYEALGFRFSRDMDIVRNGELEATNYFFSLGDAENVLELTYNHDGRTYDLGTAYGHIAIGVDDLDATLATLKDGHGIEPERPPYQVIGGRLADLLRQRSGRLSDRADRAPLVRRPSSAGDAGTRGRADVVRALDHARDDERRAQRHLHDRRGHERAERSRHVARRVRVRGRGRTLVRVDHADDVGLACRHVHLAQRSSGRSSSAKAATSFGANGISASRTFDGRCVKTIVLRSPNRPASRTATWNDSACSMPTTKNDDARAPRATSRRSP